MKNGMAATVLRFITQNQGNMKTNQIEEKIMPNGYLKLAG